MPGTLCLLHESEASLERSFKGKVILPANCYADHLSPGIGQEQVQLMIGSVEHDASRMLEHPGRFVRSHSPEAQKH